MNNKFNKAKSLPSVETILHYYTLEEDGVFVSNKTGKRLTALSSNGYVNIIIEKSNYLAHRLVWKVMTGADPVSTLDHIDGDKTNNMIENLREATHSQNLRNTSARTNNVLGVKNVHLAEVFQNNKTYRYYTGQISYNGKRITKRFPYNDLGLEQASEWVKQTNIELFGEYTYYNNI